MNCLHAFEFKAAHRMLNWDDRKRIYSTAV